MPKFRKLPVVIDAIQWNGSNRVEVAKFIKGGMLEANDTTLFPGDAVFIETLEGTMRANVGDWVIKGVAGEFYPCKPDIFEATYEAA